MAITFDWLLHFIFKGTFKHLNDKPSRSDLLFCTPIKVVADICKFIGVLIVAVILLLLMGALALIAAICTVITCGLPICLYFYHKRTQEQL